MTVLEPGTRVVVIGVGTAWQRSDMTAAIVVRKWGPRRYRVRWQDRILSTVHTSTVPRVDIRLPDRELLRLFAEDWVAITADLAAGSDTESHRVGRVDGGSTLASGTDNLETVHTRPPQEQGELHETPGHVPDRDPGGGSASPGRAGH